MAFNLKDIFSRIGSKANTERPSYRAPIGGGDIKTGMDWKHGLGEFGSKEKRRKPGESKFNYDVRMKKEARKRAMGTDIETHDPKSEIKGTFSTAETLRHSFGTEPYNPNDKRSQENLNFGIKPGMTFGEAFAQAGKGGARAGQDPFFWINPDLVKNPEQISKSFLYDFEKEEEEVKINPLTGAPEGSEIIQGKYGKVSTLPL